MFLGVARGFSVVEVVMAMGIGVVVITAAIQSSFGEQSSLTSSSLSVAAAAEAAELSWREESLAREDFNLVASTSSIAELADDIVVSLQPDLVSKLVSVHAWSPLNPAVSTIHTTLVSNLDNIEAPDTCDATLHGDWQHPQHADFDIRTLIGTTTGAYAVSDVDAFMHVLYVAIESTTYKTDPTLLALDISDPLNPTLLGMLNTSSTTAGLAALRVARTNSTTHVYAANAGSFAKGQLQIVDATDPAHLGYPVTYKIPTAYAPAAGNGRSIYYKDGLAYLGLTAAPGTTEFHIVDVHDPMHPAWLGGYAFGSGVEKIVVKGSRAYLATNDNARELAVLDVSDPTAPYVLGSYDAPGSVGSGYGRSLFVRGTTAYLGRTWVLNAGVPESHVLDVSQPGAITALATRDIGTSAHPYGVYGALVRSNLAFLLTKSSAGGQLQIVPAEPLSNYVAAGATSVDLPAGFGGTALDCEEDVLYIGSVDAGGNGMLTVVSGG